MYLIKYLFGRKDGRRRRRKWLKIIMDGLNLKDLNISKHYLKTDQSTSKPLLAATLSGMLSVCVGSTMPSVGLIALLAIPEHTQPITVQTVTVMSLWQVVRETFVCPASIFLCLRQSESFRAARQKCFKTLFMFTCFCFQRLKVKDGDSGGLAAGSCSRRNWSTKNTSETTVTLHLSLLSEVPELILKD